MKTPTFFQAQGPAAFSDATEAAQQAWLDDDGKLADIETDHNGELVALISKGEFPEAFVIGNETNADGEFDGFSFTQWVWDADSQQWEAGTTDGGATVAQAHEAIQTWINNL